MEKAPPLTAPRWQVLAALWVVVVALIVALCIGAAPPAVQPESAPPGEFSAARALILVRGLTASGLPHPVGSADHDRARDYVLAEVRALGLEPRVQKGTSCGRKGCAEVQNIIARVEGSEPGPALMLAAHYDSVPAGPGASDDGAGISTILETTRALLKGPRPRRTVILLLDDGEELATLGAKLFVASDPAAREVGVVLNFEARGTAGQTVMFETSSNAAWLVETYAREVSRPMASSVIYPLYKRLPNDTDLTVFKAAGMQGMNFAFADRYWDYHSANDNADRLDARSLQHMGDQALAVARALASADLDRRDDGEAVHFDVFTVAMITYRARWALPLAAFGLLLALGAIALALRARLIAAGSLLRGAGASLGALTAALLAGVIANTLFTAARGAHAPKGMNPMMPWLAYVGLSAAAAMSAGLLLAPRTGAPGSPETQADRLGLAGGALLVWSVLSPIFAQTVTGASYLFTLPAVALGASLLLASRRATEPSPERGARAALLAVGVTVFLWSPVARILLVMVGASVSPAATLPVGLIVTTALPTLALFSGRLRWITPLAALGVGLVGAVATFTGVGL
ncbi:MAG: M28 family peptidase [Minicystis sp.]